MITYTLLRIVILPAMRLDVSIFGIFIEINIDTQFIMLVLAAMLTAAGADWLIRSHPDFQDNGTTASHWIIPGLAALGAGAILSGIPEGLALWISLPVTSIMLMAVLVAEFVVHDPRDTRRRPAGVILTGLSYLLLLGVFYVIQAASLRAAFAVPIGFLASTAVVWRLLNLTQPGKPVLVYAAAIGGLHRRVGLGFALLADVTAAISSLHQRGSLCRKFDRRCSDRGNAEPQPVVRTGSCDLARTGCGAVPDIVIRIVRRG